MDEIKELSDLLAEIQSTGDKFSPELKKVARFVLENHHVVGFLSIRHLASLAKVNHSTMVRFAKVIGFSTFAEFREVFRPKYRPEENNSLMSTGSEMNLQVGKGFALSSVSNWKSVSDLGVLDSPDMHDKIRATAKDILQAETRYVLGVGVANSVANNFVYLADMIAPGFTSLPSGGDLPIDVLGRGTKKDILIAMTFKPYRREVIEAVNFADSLDIPIIAISNSPACPIMAKARTRFVIPTTSPHFFPSMVPITALFELLLGYLISEIGNEVIVDLRKMHIRRHTFGIYVEEANELEY